MNFLGWLSDQFWRLSDLQQLGDKKGTTWITWYSSYLHPFITVVWHLRLLPPLAVRLREQGSRHVFHFLPSVLAHTANRRRTRRGGAAGAPAGLSLALRSQRTFCCSAAAQATSHVEWCGEQSPIAATTGSERSGNTYVGSATLFFLPHMK